MKHHPNIPKSERLHRVERLRDTLKAIGSFTLQYIYDSPHPAKLGTERPLTARNELNMEYAALETRLTDRSERALFVQEASICEPRPMNQ